jgi:predicted DNA binding protein
MVKSCIRIQLPEGRWKTDVSRGRAEHSFRLLSTVQDGSAAIETVVVSGCDVANCLSEIQAHPDVDTFDTVDRRENRATVQLKTLEPAVLLAASRAGTPLVYPVVLNYGTVIATVIGTHEGISSLGDQLRDNGLGFEVVYIHSEHDVSQVLTDRQEEILFTAVEHGYYNSPRECTLTEVAEILDIAKSTCSDTLHRAEQSVVEYFCQQHQDSDRPPSERSSTPIDGYSSG